MTELDQWEAEAAETIKLYPPMSLAGEVAIPYEAQKAERILKLISAIRMMKEALNKYTQSPEYWPDEIKKYPAQWAEETLAKLSKGEFE